MSDYRQPTIWRRSLALLALICLLPLYLFGIAMGVIGYVVETLTDYTDRIDSCCNEIIQRIADPDRDERIEDMKTSRRKKMLEELRAESDEDRQKERV